MKSFRLVAFLILLFWMDPSKAQHSACINYDIESVAADDLRVDHFIKCMRKGHTLYLDGAIDETLIDELTSYSREPIRVIHLNSGGGRVESAIEVAHFIRSQEITTVVRKDALCASACTLLFQAGVKRQAHASSRFMYHGARNLMISRILKNKILACLEYPNTICLNEILAQQKALRKITNEMFYLYEQFGATESLTIDYWKMPIDPNWVESGNYLKLADWWLTLDELLEYNIVTDILK